jgi:general secretion pathway protein E
MAAHTHTARPNNATKDSSANPDGGNNLAQAAGAASKAAPASDRKLQLRDVLEWLVADRIINVEIAKRISGEARLMGGNKHPLSVVASQELKSILPPHTPLNMTFLSEWLAQRCKLPFFHIDALKIDLRAVTAIMSNEYAAKRSILPVEVKGKEVTVATAEPFVTSWEPELEQMLKMKFKRVIANPEDIERYIGEFYNLAKSVKRAELAGVTNTSINSFEQLVEMGKAGRTLDANDHHIVHIVDWLWQYAFDQRASDIHVEPRRDLGIIRFRIDGVLHQVYQVPYPVLAAMTSRIKILARMDVVEKRRPQDGRVKTRDPDGTEVELRISTLPTAHGEKIVMRIFDPGVLLRSFADLGFGGDDLALWHKLTNLPGGIVLVTGPTGSGKTTTLYTTLKQLATPEVNVCTVEDPIEMIEGRFNQMQVQQELDLGFAEAVRALMRQDPDIIMVGEIRDLETAEMAVQAALTGHLVLSTLHTNDAPTAVTRLLDLGVPSYLLKSTVNGVMAQRLVRTLCPHCKEKVPFNKPADHELWSSVMAPFKAPAPEYVYKPVGCLECRNTGYMGRLGLYEILEMLPDVKRLIQDQTDLPALTTQAYKGGMRPLRVSGAMKVAAGLTTFDEVLKVAPPANE